MSTPITTTLKIKLLRDLPIEPHHGAKAGRIFDLLRSTGPMRRSEAKFWFMGDAGEECAAFGFECEEIEE